MVNRRRGYTLIEVVVAMAVFGMFIFVILSLTVELARYERKLKIDFFRHPQVIAIVSRMRRDVLDAYGDAPYPGTFRGYTQGPKVLIIETLHESGSSQTIVWDFREPDSVTRSAYQVGVPRVWLARAMPPDFNASINAVDNPRGVAGVRLQARDAKGNLAIDQIFLPRVTH